MCDCGGGHTDVDLAAASAAAAVHSPTLSRRRLLQAGAALAVAGPVVARGTSRASATSGRPAYRCALHVHSSFSEGDGSMATQAAAAKSAGVDALFFTDHDWRIARLAFLDAVHFNGFSEPVPGGTVTWTRQTIGSVSAPFAEISHTMASPKDPSSSKGSLHVRATSATSGELLYLASAPRLNYRGNISGLKLVLEALPLQAGPDSWLEVRLLLSRQLAGPSRPAGQLVLVYRIGGGGAAGAVRNGALGTMTVPIPKGSWSTVTLSPADDVHRLWPDLDARDNALYALSVGCGARNHATAEGHLDWLRLQYGTRGQAAYDLQRDMVGDLQSRTSVRLVHAHELSYYPNHLNQFGGTIAAPTYPANSGLNPADNPTVWRKLVSDAQSHGGVVSYNHPFGTDGGKPAANQTALLHKGVQDLLGSGLYGASVLDVGYVSRAGATLATYLALWDTMSRNGLFTVGIGVSDSHGSPWGGTFTTSLYASALSEAALVAALGKGQAFCSKLGAWAGAVDLTMDGVSGSVPMGGVFVRPGLASRVVHVSASSLPAGAVVDVLATVVDYAGPSKPDPNTVVVKTIPASQLPASVTVSKAASAAGLSVRAVVRTGSTVIGFSNPVVWMEHEPPSGKPAIPAARRVSG